MLDPSGLIVWSEILSIGHGVGKYRHLQECRRTSTGHGELARDSQGHRWRLVGGE